MSNAKVILYALKEQEPNNIEIYYTGDDKSKNGISLTAREITTEIKDHINTFGDDKMIGVDNFKVAETPTTHIEKDKLYQIEGNVFDKMFVCYINTSVSKYDSEYKYNINKYMGINIKHYNVAKIEYKEDILNLIKDMFLGATLGSPTIYTVDKRPKLYKRKSFWLSALIGLTTFSIGVYLFNKYIPLRKDD